MCVLISEEVVSRKALNTVTRLLWQLTEIRIRRGKTLYVYELYSLHRSDVHMMDSLSVTQYM